MRTADMVKSKFWRARDIEGQPPKTLLIADVTEELLGRGLHQDVKCFLWFSNSPKGLQLNKSRVTLLEAAYGPDSEGWIGRRIQIYFDPTIEFGGRPVGGVGIRTEPGVVYQGGAGSGWGAPVATVPGRPPPPVWDDKRQQWITPQAPPAIPAAAPVRPPPPVWNEATGQWEVVSPQTGEIAPPAPAPAAAAPVREPIPPGRGLGALAAPTAGDPGWGARPGPTEEAPFDDDIPF